MSFAKKIKRKDGKVYAIEVQGYRDKDGKVKHKYKRYLGKVDEHGRIMPSRAEIKVDKVFQFGFLFIVAKVIEQLKLNNVVTNYEKEIVFIILMHMYNPSSISKMMHKIKDIEPSLIEIDLPINRKRIEKALDFLEENKELIEQRLYDNLKKLYDEETLFYDITSITLNGYRSTLAKIGYPEFSPQVNIGLCIEGKYGFPIFHEVFPGNISHKKTLSQILEKLIAFGRKNVILILDAGIGTEKNIENAIDVGFGVIARIAMHPNIKKIAIANKTTSFRDMIQLSNSKVYVKEVAREKGKLLVCFNEKLKVSIKERRYDEIINALERKKKGLPIKKGIKKYITKDDRGWRVDYKKLEDAEKYDGIYVLYCSRRDMPKERAVKVYFERDRIEKCFSTIKNVLEVKPIRFQMDKRIRAYIMLCYLEYLIATYIEMKLKENKLEYNIENIMELLENVYKVHIYRGDKLFERVSSMTEEQKKVMDIFGLLS